MCQADPAARVCALDMAAAMLELARRNVAEAGLIDRIACVQGDAKALDWPDGSFEAVISNTIVHHIPDPAPGLREMARLVAPLGTLFVRDLARPASNQEIASLVSTYAGTESPAAQALFEASLRAALTVDEVRTIARSLGRDSAGITLTSDRHWTWIWQRGH
jgi:ubiquinone/menaquinone biosynthesis C-methylase UbiE